MSKLDRLLSDAAEAVERADWRAALSVADEIAAIDADNEDAAAIRTLARLRASRAPAATPGTRRQITVLFADMVGSTRLASVLDPEETREVLLAYQRACAEVVERFDGHIAQFVGDGILVYFGHPRAHEDDACRAVLAGREIVERVRALPAKGPPGCAMTIPIAVRVGVHTGLVVIADMGSARHVQPNDVVGETPNVAARIHAAARPNAVVMSGDTYDLIRDVVDARALPPVYLKDVDRPMQLFEALGERVAESRFDAGGRQRSALVDRVGEQEAIAQAWGDLLETGHERGLALLGEPGIGKSHLIAYARDHVHTRGGWHRTLQCSPYHVSTPLHPVVAGLQREVRRSPAMRRAPGYPTEPAAASASLRSLADELELEDEADFHVLSRLLGVPPPAGPAVLDLSPEQLRERTFAVVLTWLWRLADRSPLLLAVEDLHWADPTTLELLARLVSTRGCAPVLTLLTSREAGPLERVGKVRTLSLKPLVARECHQLVRQVASRRLDPATRAIIVDHSNGVPLFVEELTRMFGTVAIGELGVDDIAVPSTLQDLLVARIDQFLAEHRLAQVIATVGQPVKKSVLHKLIGVAPDELDRQLGTLLGAGLLEVTTDQDGVLLYQFRHALQRDAAYQLQLRSTRRATHAEVARVLAQDVEFGGAPPQLLAYHYERADDHAAAAQQWYLAALHQAESAAHLEAIEHYRRALGASQRAPEPPPPGFELDVQAGLALSLLETLGYTSEEVARAYSRLRELSAEAGAGTSRYHLGGIYGMWAYYHVRGENATSSELAQRLLDVGLGSGASSDVLAAKAVLGYQLMWSGRFREAAEMLDEVRRGAPSAGPSPFPHDPGVGATVNLAAALWMLGRFGMARSALVEALARAEALDGPVGRFTRAYTYCFAAAHCHVAGDLEGCISNAKRTIEISSENGFASWLGAGMLLVTVASALTGEPAQYIPGIRYGLDAWRSAGAESNRTLFLLGLAQALARGGQPEEALAALDEALTQASATQELYLVSALHCLRGQLLAMAGPDSGPAMAELHAAVHVARQQEARAFELAALTAICEHSGERSEVEASAAELEQLLTSLEENDPNAEPCVVKARSVLERK